MNTQPFTHSYLFLLRHWYVLAVFGFVVSGCTEPLYWAKPKAQPGDFERDLGACQEVLGLPTGGRETHVSILDPKLGTASETIEQCLADRGWFLARKPES